MFARTNNLEKLIKKASKGHQQSQMALYEQYYGYSMSVALRFSESREDAKEIVHDAFIKVFAKLGAVDNVNTFKPWLRRIVVNTAIDEFRRKKTTSHHLDIVDHDAPDLSEDALSRLSAEDLFEIIGQLPPAYRMVFTLYAIEGFKHEEIAQKLGISVGTSKSNLSKARAKLQKQILQIDPGLAKHG